MSVIAQTWQQEIILKKNDQAPFKGVLVPEYNFREYQKAYEMRFLVDPKVTYSDLVESRNCPKCLEQGTDWSQVSMFFLGGAFLGLVAGLKLKN